MSTLSRKSVEIENVKSEKGKKIAQTESSHEEIAQKQLFDICLKIV